MQEKVAEKSVSKRNDNKTLPNEHVEPAIAAAPENKEAVLEKIAPIEAPSENPSKLEDEVKVENGTADVVQGEKKTDNEVFEKSLISEAKSEKDTAEKEVTVQKSDGETALPQMLDSESDKKVVESDKEAVEPNNEPLIDFGVEKGGEFKDLFHELQEAEMAASETKVTEEPVDSKVESASEPVAMETNGTTMNMLPEAGREEKSVEAAKDSLLQKEVSETFVETNGSSEREKVIADGVDDGKAESEQEGSAEVDKKEEIEIDSAADVEKIDEVKMNGASEV